MDAKSITPLDALFVGYEDQENLGLRWITATLAAGGWRATVQQHTPGNASAVLSAVNAGRPKLVGFSISFQPLLEEFGLVMGALRRPASALILLAGATTRACGRARPCRPCRTSTASSDLRAS